MKKIVAILAAAVIGMSLLAPKANAIEDQWEKGTFVVGGMVVYYPGFGVTAYGDYVLVDSWWKGHFTVGGQVNLQFRHQNLVSGYNIYYNWTDVAAAARATYGLNITDKFEVHAGALAGLGFIAERIHYDTTAIEDARANTLRPCLGGLAGVRYFFSDSFGVTAEFNYSNYGALANVGVAFKF